MKDAHKLLDLFYRLHFTLGTGLSPRYGYGRRDEEIAAGQMPVGDVFDGNHTAIYSTALNLYVAHDVVRDGTKWARIHVAFDHYGEWKVYVSSAARGQLPADDTGLWADALAFAAKAAKACEEILASPIEFEFDIRHARTELEDAIRDGWKQVGEDGDPDEALTRAWTGLGGKAA